MFSINAMFKPDYERYEGVRPINIYLLRLLFLLVVVFVASDSWSAILKHEGQRDHVRAAALCMWAAYSVLSIFGLINSLRWLPIVMFEIFYKIIWLVIVAYPLWSTNRLAGSPAEGMTHALYGLFCRSWRCRGLMRSGPTFGRRRRTVGLLRRCKWAVLVLALQACGSCMTDAATRLA